MTSDINAKNPYCSERFPSTSTASNDTLNIAKCWINECLTAHPDCVRTTAESSLPTRLLEITTIPEARQSSSQYAMCLKNSEDISPFATYVTLSHCWGDGVPFKLLSTNLELLLKKVDCSALSQTFQDAINISISLGVHYIWIDSLCVIQDSSVDWRHESARMDKIYKSARCNIAATSGTNGNQGCFSDREPRLLQPLLVDMRWSMGHLADKWGERGLTAGLYYLQIQHNWRREVIGSPLNNRGWVLQERLLSPRILHFTGRRIYFECNTAIMCEDMPKIPLLDEDCNEALLVRRSLGGLISENESVTQTIDPNRRCELSRSWHSIITKYNTSDLTQEEDKLIAVSGIASEIQQVCFLQIYFYTYLNRKSTGT